MNQGYCKEEYYSDLALGYIQGRLSILEKQTVFRLATEDPDFRELLRLELELAKELAKLKESTPRPVAVNSYYKVKSSTADALSCGFTDVVLTSILNIIVPQSAREMILIRKGVCVYER